MSLTEKFRAGAELFEDACKVSHSDVRSRHPEWNEDQVKAELIRRQEIGRRFEAATSR
jgi:hypothetical protein